MRFRLLPFVLALLLAGCGHKGPVRPLGLPLPAAVEALSVSQLGDSLVLTWRPPSTNQDGSRLRQLESFALYRQSYDPGDDCPECRPPKQPAALIPAEPGRDHYSYTDRHNLQPGTGYRYRIVPLIHGGTAGAAAVAARVFYAPPAPPAALSAQALERFNRLSWQPPGQATPAGYRIERAIESATDGFVFLADVPAGQHSYDDFNVTAGVHYRYRVRAGYVTESGKVLSEATAATTVTARP